VPSCTQVGELAAKWEDVLLASLFEKHAGWIYHNMVAVLDADAKYLGK